MRNLILVLAMYAFTGCADVDGAVAPLASSRGTYADAIPPERLVEIRAPRPGELTADAEIATLDHVVVIDATGDHPYFPINRIPREYADRSAFEREVITVFDGLVEVNAETGERTLSGAQGVLGTPIFTDTDVDVTYAVADPVLAWIGGVSGEVAIGGETICIDPDGECNGVASYLAPLGTPTATHINLCNSPYNNVCVQFHTFYNTTLLPFPLFVPYARHGSNVNFTVNTAVSGTSLFNDARGWNSYWFEFPNVFTLGQNSVETSRWALGAGELYLSNAVCGQGVVTDPDVNGTRFTANGPNGEYRCLFAW